MERPVSLGQLRRPRVYLSLALVAILAIGFGVHTYWTAAAPPELAFSDFLSQVDAARVSEVRFADGGMDVTLKSGNAAHTVPPPGFSANTAFVSDLVRRGVRIDVAPGSGPGSLSGSSLVLAAAFLALLGFTVYRTTAGRIHTPGRARLAETR